MSLTPRTLITNSLKTLGIVAPGETPSSDNLTDGFTLLNRLIDAWAIERLTINGIQKFSLAVTASHSPYTIGTGGDFDQPRPTWIDDVTLTIAGTTPTDIPVSELTQDEYALLAAKTIEAQLALNWYYNATYDVTTPLGAIYFWPILNDATVTINLWLPVAITTFATVDTTYTLLPGWQRALELNLAVEMLTWFGSSLDPATAGVVTTMAGTAKAAIKNVNTEPGLLGVDGGLLKPSAIYGGGNWLTGP